MNKRTILHKIILNTLLVCILSTPVLYSQVNITVNNNLVFGDVFPRIPKAVTKYEAGKAAEYHVTGPAGQAVIIQFTLPTYMNKDGYNMQMIFTNTDCSMDSSSNQASKQANPGYDNLNPWHPITYGLGTNGLTIWLGGKVVPGLVQSAGDYSADIVIRVDTTSN